MVLTIVFLFALALEEKIIASAHSLEPRQADTIATGVAPFKAPPNCFPAIGFTVPSDVPSSLTRWWCDPSTEYGFVGFSYEVTACQNLTTLRAEFLDIQQRFKGRYVRLYGACDRDGF
ncbi:hypothetical protein DXG03_001246 [Asterophora parasitica]|uniref:Uncharacterized protein n=1 Tax=Asterophora parasitica TaxID=117018 RepID=A0A9P7G5K6_9AGAR|nr:hypothetical protein DXG03_001246 [Asterophora parasitica]